MARWDPRCYEEYWHECYQWGLRKGVVPKKHHPRGRGPSTRRYLTLSSGDHDVRYNFSHGETDGKLSVVFMLKGESQDRRKALIDADPEGVRDAEGHRLAAQWWSPEQEGPMWGYCLVGALWDLSDRGEWDRSFEWLWLGLKLIADQGDEFIKEFKQRKM